MDDQTAHGAWEVQMDPTLAGGWVVAVLGNWGTVRCLVPDVFEAYCRVFHPAYLYTDDAQHPGTTVEPRLLLGRGVVSRKRVTWHEVADANARAAHPAMEWASITGAFRFLRGATQPGIWDQSPGLGSLERDEAARLAQLLTRFTSTPQNCWAGIWEGFLAPARSGIVSPKRLQVPNRPMIVFSGPLTALPDYSFDPIPTAVSDTASYRSPSLWWPDDRAWCVATDVDLLTTYVGGSLACVTAILSDPELEAMPVTADQSITWKADTVNPAPEGAY